LRRASSVTNNANASPGVAAVKATGSADGSHATGGKGEKDKYKVKVGAQGNSGVKGDAAQLQPPIQPNKDYLTHSRESR
jgi:hypothetical protein